MAGDFWPENIFPYVFLILIAGALFHIDREKIFAWAKAYQSRIILLFMAAFLLQYVLRRPDMAESMVILAKICVKMLICGITLSVILLLCAFRLFGEKNMPERLFCLLSAAAVLYFYLIRKMDEFSIYPVVLVLLLYLASGRDTGDKREKKIKLIGACFFACCETFGYMAVSAWRFHGNFFHWLCLALAGIVIWTFLFYFVLTDVLHMACPKTGTKTPEGKNLSKKSEIFIFATMAGVRFLFWMNWFPGILSKDTYYQIQQAIGNAEYSNHHPWLHTMMMKAFLNRGGYQCRIALLSFISFLLFSILLWWILCYYYEKTSARVWLTASVIYMLEPLHCVYSVSIWKDTLFAYTLLAHCLILMLMEEQSRVKAKPEGYMWPLYIISTFLFCFSRTNGLYAWFLTLPFLFWHHRKHLKHWISTVGICLLLIVVYKGAVIPGFHVAEPDVVEALSVPLQQIAYTIQNDGIFSEKDKEIIENIVDMEAIGACYDSHISDPVKNTIRGIGDQEYITAHKIEFMKMYLSVGWKNPVDYITAFLNQSRGYWYQKMSNYLYFREGVHQFAGEIGIYRDPLFPAGISSKIDRLMNLYCDIWNTFWSLALNTYAMAFLLLYCFIKGKNLFYFMPVIGVLVTLMIASPVNDEFRYAYGIYLALPLLLMQSAAEPVDKIKKKKCGNGGLR